MNSCASSSAPVFDVEFLLRNDFSSEEEAAAGAASTPPSALPPLRAQKTVLAAGSAVFRRMFFPTAYAGGAGGDSTSSASPFAPQPFAGWKESQPGLATLDLRSEMLTTREALKAFLKFLASSSAVLDATLEITSETVLPLLHLSNKYEVWGALKAAMDFFEDHLDADQAMDLAGVATRAFGASVGRVGGDFDEQKKKKPAEKLESLHLGDWLLDKCLRCIERDPVTALRPLLVHSSSTPPPDIDVAEHLLSAKAKIGKAPEILLFRWAVAVRLALSKTQHAARADALLSLIRYELMSADELKKEMVPSGLVSKKEEVVKKALAMIADPSHQHTRLKRRRKIWFSGFVGELKRHSRPVHCVATFVGLDGIPRIISSGIDRTVKLWNAESGQCERTFKGHTHIVSSVTAIPFAGCFDPKGRIRILTGSWDKTLRIWNIEERRCEAVLTGHSLNVNSVAAVMSPKGGVTYGRTAATLSEDGVAFGISGSSDKTVKIWNLAARACIRTLTGHTDIVTAVAAVKGVDGVIYIISGGGDRDNKVKIWNFSSGDCVMTLEGHSHEVGSFASVVGWADRGVYYFVSGSPDMTVKIWSLETGACLQTLRGHMASVYCVTTFIGADGTTRIASGGMDNSVKIWNTENWVCEETLVGHSSPVFGLAVFEDADEKPYLVSGSGDHTLRLWEV